MKSDVLEGLRALIQEEIQLLKEVDDTDRAGDDLDRLFAQKEQEMSRLRSEVESYLSAIGRILPIPASVTAYWCFEDLTADTFSEFYSLHDDYYEEAFPVIHLHAGDAPTDDYQKTIISCSPSEYSHDGFFIHTASKDKSLAWLKQQATVQTWTNLDESIIETVTNLIEWGAVDAKEEIIDPDFNLD